MKFHIITIFPDSFDSYLNSSILRKAKDMEMFDYKIYNLCDYSTKNTRRVDDKPYGGLPGAIISPEPLYKAIKDIKNNYGDLDVIYLSPTGKNILQSDFEKFAKNNNDYILICGHYEGIDRRIIDIFNITILSIGEYVITSGELASMILIDGIVRLLPGVINKKSLEEESYSIGIKRKREYPQYTRPEKFMGYSVPKELLSGDPIKIDKWKKNNIT